MRSCELKGYVFFPVGWESTEGSCFERTRGRGVDIRKQEQKLARKERGVKVYGKDAKQKQFKV